MTLPLLILVQLSTLRMCWTQFHPKPLSVFPAVHGQYDSVPYIQQPVTSVAGKDIPVVKRHTSRSDQEFRVPQVAEARTNHSDQHLHNIYNDSRRYLEEELALHPFVTREQSLDPLVEHSDADYTRNYHKTGCGRYCDEGGEKRKKEELDRAEDSTHISLCGEARNTTKSLSSASAENCTRSSSETTYKTKDGNTSDDALRDRSYDDDDKRGGSAQHHQDTRKKYNENTSNRNDKDVADVREDANIYRNNNNNNNRNVADGVRGRDFHRQEDGSVTHHSNDGHISRNEGTVSDRFVEVNEENKLENRFNSNGRLDRSKHESKEEQNSLPAQRDLSEESPSSRGTKDYEKEEDVNEDEDIKEEEDSSENDEEQYEEEEEEEEKSPRNRPNNRMNEDKVSVSGEEENHHGNKYEDSRTNHRSWPRYHPIPTVNSVSPSGGHVGTHEVSQKGRNYSPANIEERPVVTSRVPSTPAAPATRTSTHASRASVYDRRSYPTPQQQLTNVHNPVRRKTVSADGNGGRSNYLASSRGKTNPSSVTRTNTHPLPSRTSSNRANTYRYKEGDLSDIISYHDEDSEDSSLDEYYQYLPQWESYRIQPRKRSYGNNQEFLQENRNHLQTTHNMNPSRKSPQERDGRPQERNTNSRFDSTSHRPQRKPHKSLPVAQRSKTDNNQDKHNDNRHRILEDYADSCDDYVDDSDRHRGIEDPRTGVRPPAHRSLDCNTRVSHRDTDWPEVQENGHKNEKPSPTSRSHWTVHSDDGTEANAGMTDEEDDYDSKPIGSESNDHKEIDYEDDTHGPRRRILADDDEGEDTVHSISKGPYTDYEDGFRGVDRHNHLMSNSARAVGAGDLNARNRYEKSRNHDLIKSHEDAQKTGDMTTGNMNTEQTQNYGDTAGDIHADVAYGSSLSGRQEGAVHAQHGGKSNEQQSRDKGSHLQDRNQNFRRGKATKGARDVEDWEEYGKRQEYHYTLGDKEFPATFLDPIGGISTHPHPQEAVKLGEDILFDVAAPRLATTLQDGDFMGDTVNTFTFDWQR